jgi:NAD(P)-dependent dehydrogenase (short-subunit alcohol dehydrogenase family)
MTKILKGKVTLINGGSCDLGGATALAFGKHRFGKALTYLASEQKAAAVVEQARAKGGRAIAIQCDQGNPSAAGQLTNKVAEQPGTFRHARHSSERCVYRRPGYEYRRADVNHAALDRRWTINTMGVAANMASLQN